MEKVSGAMLPREARGMTPVADFAKLSVSAGTPERQEVSTLPVLPPMPEQAALQDIEMAATEPETEDVLGEMELMFGKPARDLTPAEEVQYQQYKKAWEEQDKRHNQEAKIAEYNVKVQEKQNEVNQKKEAADRLAFGNMFSEPDQQREESAHLAKERDAQLQAQKKADEDAMAQQ